MYVFFAITSLPLSNTFAGVKDLCRPIDNYYKPSSRGANESQKNERQQKKRRTKKQRRKPLMAKRCSTYETRSISVATAGSRVKCKH